MEDGRGGEQTLLMCGQVAVSRLVRPSPELCRFLLYDTSP